MKWACVQCRRIVQRYFREGTASNRKLSEVFQVICMLGLAEPTSSASIPLLMAKGKTNSLRRDVRRVFPVLGGEMHVHPMA
jgi:hypothetical protein